MAEETKAKMIKSCDYPASIAVQVFKMLNQGKVGVKDLHSWLGKVIITDVEPKNLIYPEGWYYAKGTFRNKHQSSTGVYDEVIMLKTNGDRWDLYANYATI